MNQKDIDKLLLRIGDARLSISIKDKLTPMDRKIDSVLKECAAVLQSQDENAQPRVSNYSFCPYCGTKIEKETGR